MLFLVGCGGEVQLEPLLTLVSEPGVRSYGALQLHNGLADHELVVTDLVTWPASAPLDAGGDGPWVLPPGTTTEIEVSWRAEALGVEQGRLVVETDVGEWEAKLVLVGAVLEDADADGWSVAMGDCDDEDPLSWPGATELCDGIDNDCDGWGDELEGFDYDGDGYLSEALCADIGGDDCNDYDVSRNPGETEECDGTDSDCNGIVDDVYELADLQDGVCSGALKVCTDRLEEPDYSEYDSDYESSEYSCDGIDNDCDGEVDGFDRDGDGTSDCEDDDGDGLSEADGDCDDHDTGLTLESCGARRLVVTGDEDDASYSLVDLNLATVTSYDLSGVLYGVVPVAVEEAVFTDRYGAVGHVDLTAGSFFDGVYLDGDTWGVGYDATDDRVWAAREDGWLTSLNLEGFDTGESAEVGGIVTGLSVDPDDGSVWACGPDGDLWHHEPGGDTWHVDVEVDCYQDPILDGDRVLVLGYTENLLVVVDAVEHEVSEQVALSHRALRGVLTETLLLVVAGPDDLLVAYDPDTLTEVWTVTFTDGVLPVSVWADPVRDAAWVSLSASDQVVRVDLATQEVDLTLSVPSPLLLAPDRPL